MTAKKLDRRTFLQGVGATAVALPFLEAMGAGSARAQTNAPMRYVIAFGGVSLSPASTSVPSATGASYTLPRAFRDLETVKNHVTLVSGLHVPKVNEGDLANIEPGGTAGHHSQQCTPILTGIRGLPRMPILRSSTSDQLVADAVGTPSAGFPSLQFSAQAESYVGGRIARISAREDSSGYVRSLDPIVSPRVAYQELFADYAAPGATQDPTLLRNLAKRRSVLDLVRGRAARLIARVGAADRIRLEQHFDEIRAIEQRLADLDANAASSGSGTACQVPADPGADPTASYYSASSQGSLQSSGYSNEDLRASIFVDLTHMAFACDRTRAVSLMLTFPQCQMGAREILGVDYTFHGVGHAGNELPNKEDHMADAVGWHVRHFGTLVDKLATTDEGGESLLDRTAMVLLFEGGNTSAHSVVDMTGVIAGRGNVVSLGQHFRLVGVHPSNLIQTAMHSVGLDVSYGEVPQLLSEILV